MLHAAKERHGGLDRAERRYLEKYMPGQLQMNFTGGLSNEERKYRARKLRDDIRRTKDAQKRVEATRRSAEKTKDSFVSMGYAVEKAAHQMGESFRVLEDVQLISLGVVLDDHRK